MFEKRINGTVTPFIGRLCSEQLSSVNCEKCRGCFQKPEDPSAILTLAFPPNEPGYTGTDSPKLALLDFLRFHTRREAMVGENQYDCEVCKEKTNAQKEISYEKFSEHVTIMLKRRVWGAVDENGSATSITNTTEVQFPVKGLKLESTLGDPNDRYDLSAVMNHRPAVSGIDRGHYTAWKLLNGVWYLCDDEKCTIMPLMLNAEFIISPEACVLVYKLHVPLPSDPATNTGEQTTRIR